MKINFKTITGSVAAIALIAAVSAFSVSKTTGAAASGKSERRALLWYEYNGGDATQPSGYDLMDEQPANEDEASSLCPDEGQVCVIRANSGSGDHPAAFSSSFQNEISNAVSSGIETANVKLRGN